MADPKRNPAYFGPSVVHQTFDLTSMVDEIEGARRNLPQIQFAIPTPLGERIFIVYQDGFDGVDAAVTGPGESIIVNVIGTT